MSWIYLLIAGIFEIGWPLGFKLSTQSANKFWGLTLAVISMAMSGFFLWLAQKEIPIGTAYAIWTGIGAGGTFIIGILLFKDSTDILRLLSFFLIIVGIIGLKLTS
mgnify:FL=1